MLSWSANYNLLRRIRHGSNFRLQTSVSQSSDFEPRWSLVRVTVNYASDCCREDKGHELNGLGRRAAGDEPQIHALLSVYRQSVVNRERILNPTVPSRIGHGWGDLSFGVSAAFIKHERRLDEPTIPHVSISPNGSKVECPQLTGA